MRLLVLGGSHFLGRAIVDEAVTEHLIDHIVNGLVAHLEHRQQFLTR